MSMWRIGHRGACGYAPENTFLSMQKAINLGVDAVEFDIQLSADGVPVIIHDDTLERTTNGHGKVSDYTVAQLQTFDAGQGEIIPTLTQMFEFIDKRCGLLIELKAEHSVAPVVDIIEQFVRKGWSYEQCMMCAFDHEQMAQVKALNAQIPTCVVIAGIPVSLSEIGTQAGAWAFNPCINHINQKLVDDAHKRGMKVFTWTVNEPYYIAKAKALGVDGIISNYPDRIT
jgi:glycerophosphoryl diester phosphodiesterase